MGCMPEGGAALSDGGQFTCATGVESDVYECLLQLQIIVNSRFLFARLLFSLYAVPAFGIM